MAYKAERDLVRRGALGLEWADARYAGKCSEGDVTPVELANNAAHDLRTAAIQVSSAEAFFAFADLCDEMLRRDRLMMMTRTNRPRSGARPRKSCAA